MVTPLYCTSFSFPEEFRGIANGEYLRSLSPLNILFYKFSELLESIPISLKEMDMKSPVVLLRNDRALLYREFY